MPEIKFTLDKSSIDRAAEKFKEVVKETLNAEEYINNLLQYAYDYATEHLLDLALYAESKIGRASCRERV